MMRHLLQMGFGAFAACVHNPTRFVFFTEQPVNKCEINNARSTGRVRSTCKFSFPPNILFYAKFHQSATEELVPIYLACS